MTKDRTLAQITYWISENVTTVVTVVFILGMSVFNVLFLVYVKQPLSRGQFPNIFSNVIEEVIELNGDVSMNAAIGVEGSIPDQEKISFAVVDDTALLNVNNPLSNVVATRNGVLIYKVQSGDNLSKIAANFGISVNTLLWANSNVKGFVSPGQELAVLPVNGVLHQIQSSDTLDSVASQYGVDAKRVQAINANSRWAVGSSIIIPDGRPLQGVKITTTSQLPSLPGYFAIPTTGWNWGKLHNTNAVDIANACGTSIYAAAEGLVVEVAVGWNGGFGNFVLIEHPNGTKTRYAHNENHFVSVGDYIQKGDRVATIGNTGNTHGPTGCHLHFEVIGAKNPFAK